MRRRPFFSVIADCVEERGGRWHLLIRLSGTRSVEEERRGGEKPERNRSR